MNIFRRLSTTAVSIVLLAAGLPGGPALAAEPPQTGPARSERFSGQERITAVDLVVEVQRRDARLEAKDFTVTEGGVSRPVVGVEAEPDAEPWRLVVWFDLPLAEPGAVAWAAGALAERAADLTALGDVEIVLAGAEARTALAATRDPSLVALALEHIAGEPDAPGVAGGRDELVRLRREVARELVTEASPVPPRELAETAAEEELRFVRERADLLLLYLLAVGEEPGVGPRRALLWVTSGWDADPSAFYRARLEGLPAEPGELIQGADATVPTGPENPPDPGESLARTLAAHGWTALLLAPPVPEPPEWHLRRRAQVALDRLHEPKRGEAFRELGEQRARQGDLEGAADAFADAIHAFYDHPASAGPQALAEAQLADVLDRMGRGDEAERLLQRAVRRDPSLTGRYPGAAASLSEPLAALAAVAEATAGRLVEEKEEEPGALDSALASLGRRVRITYQVAGLPDGTLRPVEVTLRAATLRQRSPRWARSGTPERIAEARLRRLLAGGAAGEGTLRVRADPRDGGLQLEVDAADGTPQSGRLPSPSEQGPQRVFRISVASVSDTVQHQLSASSRPAAGDPWAHRIEMAGEELPAAVLVEDLVSGSWGWVPLPAGAGEADVAPRGGGQPAGSKR